MCDINCEGGNCIGCRNGIKWCDDTRCNPYCTDCLPNKDNYKVEIIIFVFVGLFIFILLFGLIYLYGDYKIYKFVPHTKER